VTQVSIVICFDQYEGSKSPSSFLPRIAGKDEGGGVSFVRKGSSG
jgi:hypothetical protein